MKNKLLRSIVILLIILINTGSHILNADTREAHLLRLVVSNGGAICNDPLEPKTKARVEEIVEQMTRPQKMRVKQLMGYERETCWDNELFFCEYLEEVPLNVFILDNVLNKAFIDSIIELTTLGYLNVSHVTHLIIRPWKVEETTLIKLFESKFFKNLEIIDFQYETEILSDKVYQLIETNYPNLINKSLDNRDFTDNRLPFLENRDFSKVKKLMLNRYDDSFHSYTMSRNPLDTKHLKLIQTFNLQSLNELYMDFSELNEEVIDAFFDINFKNAKKLFLANVNEYIISKVKNLGKEFLENLDELHIIKSENYSMDDFLNTIMQAELESYITAFNFKYETYNNYSNIDKNLKLETISLMASRNWAKLKIMNLNDSITDQTQLIELMKGDWSRVQVLGFNNSANSQLHLNFNSAFSSNWPNLKELHIAGYSLDANSMESFSLGDFDALEILLLSHTTISHDGLQYLVKTNLPKLKELSLKEYDNKATCLDDRGAYILSKGNWPLLNYLSIDASLSGIGLYALTQANWPLLDNLSIWGDNNKIDDTGLYGLKHANWYNLRRLLLNTSNITSKGIMDLAKANFPKLEDLTLWGDFDDSALIHLADAYFSKIRMLSFRKDNLTLPGLGVFLRKLEDGRWPHFHSLHSSSIGYRDPINPEYNELQELMDSYGYSY